MTRAATRRSDVVIVGAGPAGLSAAVGLRRHSLSVQVVEQQNEPRFIVGETLPGDARTVLDELGVWSTFCRQDHLPSAGNASAWGSTDLARLDAFTFPLGGGWHIDRFRFQCLIGKAAGAAGAEMVRARRVVRVQSEPRRGWLIDTVGEGGPSQLRARALVDATGHSATIARWLGAARCVEDRMVCAYAVFNSEHDGLEGRTLVESAPEGWWYAAPIPGRRTVVALFSDPAVIRAHQLRNPRRWRDALARTTHAAHMVPAQLRAAELRLVAVTSHCLSQAAGPDWVAVGDAAASVDPLASSGLTTALRDGQRAAEALATQLGGDPRALSAHSDHVRQRFHLYRGERAAYYALERRWPRSAFWRSRSRAADARDFLVRERSRCTGANCRSVVKLSNYGATGLDRLASLSGHATATLVDGEVGSLFGSPRATRPSSTNGLEW